LSVLFTIGYGRISATKNLHCAISAGAQYIVTNDKHFNVLKEVDFPKVQVLGIAAFKEVMDVGNYR
jgi:2-keto-3-deoxy-6-phosphogluconate aldolase